MHALALNPWVKWGLVRNRERKLAFLHLEKIANYMYAFENIHSIASHNIISVK